MLDTTWIIPLEEIPPSIISEIESVYPTIKIDSYGKTDKDGRLVDLENIETRKLEYKEDCPYPDYAKQTLDPNTFEPKEISPQTHAFKKMYLVRGILDGVTADVRAVFTSGPVCASFEEWERIANERGISKT
jgi:hypothetical protein